MFLLPHKVGSFTLHRKLGTGGIAEAYAGVNEVLAKAVVVRRILPYVLREPARMASIDGRVKDLLGVRHPFLVHVVDHVVEGEEHFVVEEHIDGVTLEKVLNWCRQTSRHIPHNVYLNIATQVCNGLEALHGRQGKGTSAEHVLHLSLKPGAIFLTRDGKVVVGSYGLTRSPTALPHGGVTGPVPTRMEYLSPEQTHPDQKLTPASDIFSLGAVLYELLTLESLFRAESNLQTIHKVRRAEVTTQLLRVKERMPGLDKVLFRALSMNPRHRYQRAFVLREDLRGLMAGYSFATIAEDTRTFLAPLMESLSAPSSAVSDAPDAPDGADSFEDAPATRIDPDPMTTAMIAAQSLAERVAREREQLARIEDHGLSETTENTSPRDERDPPTEVRPEPELDTHDRDRDRPTVSQDPPSVTGQLGKQGKLGKPRGRAGMTLSPEIDTDIDTGVSASIPDPGASAPDIRGIRRVTSGESPSSTAAFLAGEGEAPHPPAALADPSPTYTPEPEPETEMPSGGGLAPPRTPPPMHLAPSMTLAPDDSDVFAPPPPPATLARPSAAAGFSRAMPPPNIASTPAPLRATPVAAPLSASASPAFAASPGPTLAPLTMSAPAPGPSAQVASPLPPPRPPVPGADVFDEPEPPRRNAGLFAGTVAVAAVAVMICGGGAAVGYYAFYGKEAGTAVAETVAPDAKPGPLAASSAPTASASGADAADVMADGAPPHLDPIADEATPPAPSPVSGATAAPLQPAAAPIAKTEPTPMAKPVVQPAPPPAATPAPAPKPAPVAKAQPRPQPRAESSYTPRAESSYTPQPKPASAAVANKPASALAAKPQPAPTPVAKPQPTAVSRPQPAPTAALDVSVAEAPVSELDRYADNARRGKLESTDISVLEMTDITDPQYTRSRALLIMNAQTKGDDKGTKRYLDQVMQVAENQYNPVYLTDYARWHANHGEYDRALDKATLAERYWARLPSDLVFTKKAEIYEVEAASWQGKFYKSGEDMELLQNAIKGWEKYRNHVATRSRTDLQKRADAEIAKLTNIKERIQ